MYCDWWIKTKLRYLIQRLPWVWWNRQRWRCVHVRQMIQAECCVNKVCNFIVNANVINLRNLRIYNRVKSCLNFAPLDVRRSLNGKSLSLRTFIESFPKKIFHCKLSSFQLQLMKRRNLSSLHPPGFEWLIDSLKKGFSLSRSTGSRFQGHVELRGNDPFTFIIRNITMTLLIRSSKDLKNRL